MEINWSNDVFTEKEISNIYNHWFIKREMFCIPHLTFDCKAKFTLKEFYMDYDRGICKLIVENDEEGVKYWKNFEVLYV